jgi:Flp pilus assembly protein TadD
VRATAFDELLQFLSPQAMALAVEALTDEDPMVRRSALGLVEYAPPQDRFNHIWPLLDDPVRTVRTTAARILATTSAAAMGGDLEEKLNEALAEYIEVELTNSDRDFAHMNIGLVHSRRGELVEAEKSYRTALKLEPRTIQPRVNLADLYRSQGKDAEGEAILHEGIEIDPKSAPLRHALGLLLVRQKRMDEAVGELKLAAELDPDDPSFSYVYGVALNATGKPTEAIDALARALERHPHDRELLFALATMSRDQGAMDAARGYAQHIIDQYPDDPNARALLDSLDAPPVAEGES